MKSYRIKFTREIFTMDLGDAYYTCRISPGSTTVSAYLERTLFPRVTRIRDGTYFGLKPFRKPKKLTVE